MNILFIPAPDHYRDFIGKSYYDLITYYKNNSKNKVKIFWGDHRRLNLIKEFNKGYRPDLIVFFDTDILRFANKFNKLFNYSIPIAYAGMDLFWTSKCFNCKYINKCNSIIHFGKASKLISSYIERFPNKKHLYFKSRFINVNRFKDWKQEKKYDILLYGTYDVNKKRPVENHKADQDYIKLCNNKGIKIGKKYSFYPLRRRLKLLLSKNKYKSKFKIKILKPKCIHNSFVANEDLSKLINQSYITMATSSRADILMHKYLEISASYSAILGNIPSDYNDLLKNNIIEVNEFMSDNEIINKISYYLDNKEILFEMTKRLGDKIHKEHNFEKAVENFNQVFKNCI